MLINKELFDKIAQEAKNSPRLRKNFDLRDSEDENSQRMLNVLLPGTKTPIHRHPNTSETVLCIYGSCIERFYDNEGNETETYKLTAGGDLCGIQVPQGQFHSLEACDSLGVVAGFKAGKYAPLDEVDRLD